MNLCCLVVVMQINNAGSNAYSYKPLAESSDEDLLWELLLLIHEFVVLHLVGVNIITVLCREVVSTNTLGLMLCCREVKGLFSCLLFKHYAGSKYGLSQAYCMHSFNKQAIKMMSNQPRGGHIFNMDGAGSDGRPTPRCSDLLYLLVIPWGHHSSFNRFRESNNERKQHWTKLSVNYIYQSQLRCSSVILHHLLCWIFIRLI